ncbi:MAG: sugar phosphate nucleotidyltransferase [Patescibacteria group bacterium]
MNFVILAGGVGERLWPLGTPGNPKQFHVLLGDQPLIVQAVRRVQKAGGDIFFSTSERYVPLIKKLFSEIPDDHYIIEPARRDTGPAMAYAAARLMERAPDEPMAFIPSDHVIHDEARFVQMLRVGEEIIREQGVMVDVGVPAKFPSTVLGYTHIGKKLEERDGVEVYEFLGHAEKPDRATAEKYCAAGGYLWHANYYMWTPRKILEALERYAPEIHAGVTAALTDPAAFEKIQKISFDYAITEHMDPKDVLILKGDFDWSDVGAWDVLYDELAKTPGENVTRGEVTALDCSGSLVFSQNGRKVGVIGLKDMVVVDTPEGLLVCPKDRAQEVKRLVQEMGK